ncbi:MAG: amidohydrolase [Flavobacteriaceae bacterium]|uniref:amidohydrolase n=1 Tax=Maribacter dokdonensis TaxID=320912 RepID=UPI003287A6C0
MLKNTITIFFLLLIFSCQKQQKEELNIYYNGEILTINNTNEIAEAIAIKGEKIEGIGTLKELEIAFANTYTLKKIDLNGKTLMPGIYESHAHPIWGAMKELYQLNFDWYIEPKELKTSIANYIETKNPKIVQGGAWGSQYFEKYNIKNPRKWLDEINSEIPIALFDDASHNMWVNSAALAFANIDKNTTSPLNGRIEKDSEGEPNGILYENATFLVRDKIEFTTSEYENAIAYAQKQALSFGITAIKVAGTNGKSIEIFADMDRKNNIDMFFAICQQTPEMVRDTALNIQEYIDRAEQNKTANIDPYFVKFFLDGIPTSSSKTAAMLCPYRDKIHHKKDYGMIHIKPEILSKDVVSFDAAGFTIKIHAAGDRSARNAIDAISKARSSNPINTRFHEIAHASFLSKEDILRMSKLNIAADLSPYLWFPSPIIDDITNTVCEENSKEFWPIKDLGDHNIRRIAGSDWPAVAEDLNPWYGLEAMITRKDPDNKSENAFIPEQAISLNEALRIFTINGAKSFMNDSISGSLEVGKYANFIILDKALAKIPASGISEINVESTYFKGEKKYTKSISN